MARRWIALAGLALAGCGAIKTQQNAAKVELSNERPTAACRYLGEATGSQGNWFTGDYTSNKNLMQGARNDLRNRAAAMGGNYVWVQNVSNAQAHGALGTSNTTTVGNVYVCGTTAGPAPVQTARSAMTSPTPTVSGNPSITTPMAGVVDVAQAPADQASTTAQVLAAQRVATSQGCGDVANFDKPHTFAAVCSGYRIVIECDAGQCRPVRALQP